MDYWDNDSDSLLHVNYFSPIVNSKVFDPCSKLNLSCSKHVICTEMSGTKECINQDNCLTFDDEHLNVGIKEW